MVVEASSFRANGVDDLEAVFHQNMHDVRTLVALEAELDRRSTPRARELRALLSRVL